MCCRVTSRNLVPSLQSKSHVPRRLSPNDEAASRKKQVQLDLRATCPPAPSRVTALLKSAWLSLSSKQRLPHRADRIQPCPLPTPPPAALGPALHTPLGLHLHQEGRVKDRTGQTHSQTLPLSQPAGSSPPRHTHHYITHTGPPPRGLQTSQPPFTPTPALCPGHPRTEREGS